MPTQDLFVFFAPGFRNRNYVTQMLHFGQQIRDTHLWNFPILPGAASIYQELASNREWKVVGGPRNIARAVEYLNNAQTRTYSGYVEYGFEQFERRRSMDHICMGRTMFTWDEDKPIRYLDPYDMNFFIDKREWINHYTGERFPEDKVVVNHPIPLGSGGNFVAPIAPVIPSAMLAWLIREHDQAAADGRKIRDITIVLGKELSEQIATAVDTTLNLWAGATPSSNGVPVVFAENTPEGLSASDLVTRLGLANIPENFVREQFAFQYVNEIGANLGLALRHFWNAEEATNRALEEVQEARQQQKGPASYVRTEQRLLNMSGSLRQFGSETRFAFIEEVDTQTRETNAKVLKLYAEGLQIFATVFNATVNGDALLAWLQSEDILPSDLDLITKIDTIKPDSLPVPTGETKIQESDSVTTRKALDDIPDYEEVAMDMNGNIIERRHRIINFSKILQFTRPIEQKEASSFSSALKKARINNCKRFDELYEKLPWQDEDQKLLAQSIYERKDNLTDDDHRKIKALIDVA